MKKQCTKKFLSVLLTVVMILSALPLSGVFGNELFTTTATAADGDGEIDHKYAIDENTSIQLFMPIGTYSDEVTFKTSEVTEGKAFEIAQGIDEALKVKVYSLETFVNGVSTQPNGKVHGSIPLPEGFNDKNTRLFYINVDENKAEIQPPSGGYNFKGQQIKYFESEHLGYWAVVELDIRVVSIELKEPLIQKDYLYKSGVSTDGMKIYATYSNGRVENVTDKVTFKNFSTDKIGKHTATIEFEGATTTFEYGVYTRGQMIFNGMILEISLLFGYMAVYINAFFMLIGMTVKGWFGK